MSQKLQSQIDALKDTKDALTASNTALQTKLAFLLSYLCLQESPDGQVINRDIVAGCKKTFVNVIAESLLTSSTGPLEITVPNTTAPTTAATSSANLAFKQVPTKRQVQSRTE